MKFEENTKFARVFALVTIGIFLFWLIGKTVDVYGVAFLGAVFELLWLPMLVGLLLMPILSGIFWAKDQFKLQSMFLYVFILSIVIILMVIYI